MELVCSSERRIVVANAPALTQEELKAAIDRLPRVSLAAIPTPIQEAPNLTEALGGPRILIKREDLTGLGMGGNKVRHMEFCIPHALAQGANVNVNVNGPTSNNSRVIGAASKRVGMRYACVVPGGKGRPVQGNLLVLDLIGTEMHLLDTTDNQAVESYVAGVVADLEREGHTPYVHTHELMSRSSGSIAYLEATLEIAGQLTVMGVDEVKFYIASGASQGGLLMGAKALALPWQVTGVVWADPSESNIDVVRWANGAADYLGLPLSITWDEVDRTTDYVGEGYGVPGPDCIEAIRMMAELEGIILDPIYTGKALAAVIDHTRRGVLTPEDTVLFVHTGGLPEVFGYADILKRS